MEHRKGMRKYGTTCWSKTRGLEDEYTYSLYPFPSSLTHRIHDFMSLSFLAFGRKCRGVNRTTHTREKAEETIKIVATCLLLATRMAYVIQDASTHTTYHQGTKTQTVNLYKYIQRPPGPQSAIIASEQCNVETREL